MQIYTYIKLNILFVFFTLPHLSQSSMYSDMVNTFHKNGNNIFPMAPINNEERHSYISTENGVDVLRVKTRDVFSSNKFEKGFANILLSYQYKKSYKNFWKDKDIDLIVVATPSVMFADFISYLKKKRKTRVYLMQKDIFPQNAVDLGFMRKDGIFYDFFKKNEIKLLQSADWIGCTSPGNIKYLLNHYSFLKEERVKLLYNCTNILDISVDAMLLSKYNLENKFIVVFGGNMGKPQQLENILCLAKKCKIYHDVLFLIIGKGTEVENLKQEIRILELNNITIFDKVPREDYFELLANCNIGLISLHQDFTVPNTPMKLNDYLNAGIPVLASIDRSNDLGDLLVKNKMGRYAFADTPDDLFIEFVLLYENKNLCNELGENGKRFCFENLSAEKAYIEIMKDIKN